VPLPYGVTLVRAMPAQLRFGFERPASRAVPVTVRFTGSLEDGLRIAGFEAVPRQLVISGAASSVNTVESLETDPVNLTGVSGDIQRTVAVFAADPAVRFVGGPRVIVKVHVEKSGN
jgi:YbbR domain-containing protein